MSKNVDNLTTYEDLDLESKREDIRMKRAHTQLLNAQTEEHKAKAEAIRSEIEEEDED